MSDSSTLYWLWLSSLAEVNLNAKAALLEVFGDPEAAFHAPKGFYAGIEGISARDAEALEARGAEIEGVQQTLQSAETKIKQTQQKLKTTDYI